MRNAIRMLPTYETIFFETVSKECKTVCSEVHEDFSPKYVMACISGMQLNCKMESKVKT